MTQSVFANIDPNAKSGTQLATDLNNFKDSLLTSHSGSSRPSYAAAGTTWVKTSVTPYEWYYYDGADDILIGTINATTNAFTPAGIGTSVQGYDVDTVKKDVENNFSAVQYFGTAVASPSGGSVTWNVTTQQSVRMTITQTTTITLGGTIRDGASYQIEIIQGNTSPNSIVWPGAVKWGAEGAPTISSGVNGVKDIFTFKGDGTNLLCVGRAQGF